MVLAVPCRTGFSMAYSARVIFHEGFYSGVWYGNRRDYGGILSGRIVRPADKNKRSSEFFEPRMMDRIE